MLAQNDKYGTISKFNDVQNVDKVSKMSIISPTVTKISNIRICKARMKKSVEGEQFSRLIMCIIRNNE